MSELLASYSLPPALETAVAHTVGAIDEHDLVARIWAGDHTVWQPEPEEVANRLGWLDIAERMMTAGGEIDAVVKAVKDEGYSDVVVLGMGGSSLAPEVFGTIFGAGGGLRLTVLDSTSPSSVARLAEQVDYARTLFIVSSKSGGTTETLSFFKTFYNAVATELGEDAAGAHFVAITDPESYLGDLAKRYGFRHTFVNDPNIGGRYSALSYFGLVPAALAGVDIGRLLERAQGMADASGATATAGRNPAVYLGAVIGAAAREGRDKLTVITSAELSSFGYWLEQLVAESTGKEGVGILPVEGEPLGGPGVYGDDRLFVFLALGDDKAHQSAAAALEESGHPVVYLSLADAYDLGAEMWRWEMATAVAGHVLDINPFDQPNVESAKKQARKMTDAYAQSGQLPTVEPTLQSRGVTVYEYPAVGDVSATWQDFLSQVEDGDYVAFLAYAPATPELGQALLGLRTAVRDRLKVATTTGYGPRYLHSTGQLHKGDGGNGLFVFLTPDDDVELAIPREAGAEGSDMDFGVLVRAQALGDIAALREADRRIIRFGFPDYEAMNRALAPLRADVDEVPAR